MNAVTADKVIVDLEARDRGYNATIRTAERNSTRAFNNMGRGAQQAERVVTSSFRGMGAAVGLLAGAAGLAAGARAFLQYADSAKNIEARLRLATREVGSFAQATKDVRDIATATRTDLDATSRLYAGFARSARELGLAQGQVRDITTAVSQSFIISGSSASEAASGTRQLIQAFQSGVLRGDEFNSIMENAPRLARLLADSLNLPVARLRAMAEEGELTADKLAAAFSNQRLLEGLQREFEEMPVTFDQSLTLMNNAATVFFGAFDRGGGFSEAIAGFFARMAQGWQGSEEDAERWGISVRAEIEAIGITIGTLSDAFGPVVAGWWASVSNFLTTANNALRNFFNEYHRAALGPASQSNAGADWYDGIFNRSLASLGPGGAAVAGARMFSQANRATVNRVRDRRTLDADARRQGLIVRGGRSLPGTDFQRYLADPQNYDMYGRPRRPQRPMTGGGDTNRRGRGRQGPSAEQLAERQQRDDLAFEREMQRVNDDLLDARQMMTATAESIAQLEIQRINAERDSQNAEYTARAELAQGSKDIARTRAAELIEANNRLAAARVDAVNAREAERIREEALDRATGLLGVDEDVLQAQSALADTTSERLDYELRILDLAQQRERLELEGVLASKRSTQAEKDIAQVRLDMLDTLYQARANAARRGAEGPSAEYLRQLRRAPETIAEDLDRITISGLEAFNDGLVEAALNSENLGDTFKNVAKGIIADLARIAIQQAIIRPLASQLLGGSTGGGWLGTLFNLGASVVAPGLKLPGKAAGGSVQKGKMYMVGERGPEPFIPGASGAIIPNNRMTSIGGTAGMGDIYMPISVSAPGANAQTVALIEATMRQAAPTIIAGAKAATLRQLGRRKMTSQ